MADPSTADVFRRARELYAANPSHAPLGSLPAHGTVCVVQALACAAGPEGACGAEGKRCYWDARDVFCGVLDLPDEGVLMKWNAENDTPTVLAAFTRAIEAVST